VASERRALHVYRGRCPDVVNGPDSHDPGCPECRRVRSLEAVARAANAAAPVIVGLLAALSTFRRAPLPPDPRIKRLLPAASRLGAPRERARRARRTR
jgi:hypothetical protein